MSGVLKPQELDLFSAMLTNLRARLRGDLAQMSDETVANQQGTGSGNLANIDFNVSDPGAEAYDQEFIFSLIENEKETLEQIQEALDRIRSGTYGQCVGCRQSVGKLRLQALPYTRHCIQCARDAEKRRDHMRLGRSESRA